MVFRTSKRTANGGQMLRISSYKADIAKGIISPGTHPAKIAKICAQVAKMREQMEICKRYQPFTSNASKRRPRQVGA